MPRTPPSPGQRLLCLPGKATSWLIIPLALSVVLSVIAAKVGWSVLLDWEGRLPVLGQALTVNSLIDFQWYAFALMVAFGGVWAFYEDRHVTVDFLAIRLKPHQRAYVAIFGNLFLLLPICALVIWYGSTFAGTAWRTQEGSNQGGLMAHWLIKAALPLSFAMLGLAGVLRSLGALRLLRRPPATSTETPDGD